MSDKTYWVYIMANPWSRVLYVGMTNDIIRRAAEHKQQSVPGFTQRYSVTSLVYFEEHSSPSGAIAREKQIKGWLRAKRVALIESTNPEFNDLAAIGMILDCYDNKNSPDRRTGQGCNSCRL